MVKKMKKVKDTKLYDLLGVECTSTQGEICKAYRVMALKVHPDKNPDDINAKNNFQALTQAYEILRNESARMNYDENGLEEEGEIFDTAYDYYRHIYPKIDIKDIESFESTYRMSNDETDDLINFYNKNKGDVSRLLDYIPLSTADDVNRYIDKYESLITDGTIIREKGFKPSLERLYKAAKRYKSLTSKEAKEVEKLGKENSLVCSSKSSVGEGGSVGSLDALAQLINKRGESRAAASLDFLDALAEKYKEKPKRKNKK
eukprot:GHVR01141644.1.p1 GENE.GHVR01141644.1~~GHVR01141644.1.p1  ORF type:complete len:260 (-),score=72.71 GHVR01141644.1:227-1006(-)